MSRRHEGTASQPVVLFYTDNGFGLGHLTRLAAVASRARGAFTPVFLTMSAGYPLLSNLGLPAEYFPSYGQLGLPKQQWEPLVAERVLESIKLTGASVVVVDHVSPPRVFGSLRNHTEGVRFVWSRRGLWQPDRNTDALRNSESFDLIVEPGDLAFPVDQGPTVGRHDETVPTDPVVLIDRAEFLGRDEARDELGIPRSGRAVLINLGDSNPSEVESSMNRVKSILNSKLDEQIHVFAPLHPLHGGHTPNVDGVTMAPVYPVARYLNAFDGAVSTSGYNSFHEIVGSGLPAVFIPRGNSRIDDQVRRAEFGALSGRAGWAPDVSHPDFQTAVQQMLGPNERKIAERVTAFLGDMKGAYEFADILAEVVHADSGRMPRGIVRDELAHSGLSARQPVEPDSETTLVNAIEHGDHVIRDLAQSLDAAQARKTVFLVCNGDPSPLYSRGFVFESVMTETEWSAIGGSSYSNYLDSRIAGIIERYEVAEILAPPAGDTAAQASL